MIPETLDPGCLYMFVFGPGFGESIAVRVPPDRWLVIDSCYVAGRAAALHVLPRYGGQCECLVLTHRHQDHYPGFSSVVDYAEWPILGCNDLLLDERVATSRDLESRLTGELEQAFSAIRERWTANSACIWWTWRDSTRNVGDASLTALHPREELARNYAGRDNNELSSAVLLTWRKTRLLLGADVPNPHWAEICERFPSLGNHQAMKTPHHGSDEALHDGFLQGTRERLWIVTPYNRGKKLPRFGDGHAVHRMLRHVGFVYLTGLPSGHDQQMGSPCEATRQELNANTSPRPVAFSLPGGIQGTVDPVRNDVSCYVVARFDEAGRGEVTSCGPGTVRVTEAAMRRDA